MDEARKLIDKPAIHELCARYTLTLDRHDIGGWANCFTEDGVFGFGKDGLAGREKIAAYGNVPRVAQASATHNPALLAVLTQFGTGPDVQGG